MEGNLLPVSAVCSCRSGAMSIQKDQQDGTWYGPNIAPRREIGRENLIPVWPGLQAGNAPITPDRKRLEAAAMRRIIPQSTAAPVGEIAQKSKACVFLVWESVSVHMCEREKDGKTSFYALAPRPIGASPGLRRVQPAQDSLQACHGLHI